MNNINGDMRWAEKRESFEKNCKIYEKALLKFNGIDEGYDVYNCSIPFIYEGKKYIYGRVELHDQWAQSKICLFSESAPDEFQLTENSEYYHLEDPFISVVNNKLIMGGVSVIKTRGKIKSFFCPFYQGESPEQMQYFTTGPLGMKDIRLVQIPNGIGVFTRPGGRVGFTVIKDISELDDKIISEAPLIDFIDGDGYGGMNQCYYLSSGMIGALGHMVYPKINNKGETERVYVNVAAIFDPETRKTLGTKIIGTRYSYPESDHIKISPDTGVALDDTAFTTGLVMRDDGKVDLYSGLSDALEGRITIDYPFEGYGKIVYGSNIIV